MQRLLRFAGLDPEHALVRWGNFDRTVLLPSTVFEPDETGRSYRFRPNVRSIWVRNFPMKGPVKAYFQVPDKPEVAELVKGTGAQIVDGSTQTTNSWGLRGPEPDLKASWRGIVLGDSYMQGLFVGDHETPTECLKRDLKSRLGAPVEILNTGHLGYSPEQYYYSLVEYGRSVSRPSSSWSASSPTTSADSRKCSRARATGRRGATGWAGSASSVLERSSDLPRRSGPLGQPDRRAADGRAITRARSPTSWKRPGSNISTRSPTSPTPSSRSSTNPGAPGLTAHRQPALQRADRRRPFLGARDVESGPPPSAAGVALLIEKRQVAKHAGIGEPATAPRTSSDAGRRSDRCYSPITLTSTRLARRPSNSP